MSRLGSFLISVPNKGIYSKLKLITLPINKYQYRNMSSKLPDFTFKQLLDYPSFTYTYLLGDNESRKAIIIDPVLERVEQDAKLLKELGFNLVYALNTHVHADHVTGSGELKKHFKNCKSLISKNSGGKADDYFINGDWIEFGKFKVECRSTPGHTDGCTSYVWHEKEKVFTGDALFVRGCGRTDFQNGSPEKLYKSVHEQVYTLPDQFMIYPGHDYNGNMASTVGEEKMLNPRLTKSVEEFSKIMNNLNLPKPKLIDIAVPANLVDGIMDQVPKQ